MIRSSVPGGAFQSTTFLRLKAGCPALISAGGSLYAGSFCLLYALHMEEDAGIVVLLRLFRDLSIEPTMLANSSRLSPSCSAAERASSSETGGLPANLTNGYFATLFPICPGFISSAVSPVGGSCFLLVGNRLGVWVQSNTSSSRSPSTSSGKSPFPRR